MAGLVFINGNLLTQDPEQPRAEALAVDGDLIAAVGSQADVERVARPGARSIDLGGRTLVPGFIDAHAHAWKLGQLLTGVLDVRGVERLTSLSIEHLGLPDRGHLRRAASLKIVAVPQTVFIHSLGRNFREYRPDALLARVYPVREMMEAGIPVALSSDAPVVEEDSPLLGIQAAVLRRDAEGIAIAPDQAISAAEALRAYTAGGAFASGDEANRGTLSPGKWADLAVLSGDPVAVDPEGLSRIRVDMTVVGGKIVFER